MAQSSLQKTSIPKKRHSKTLKSKKSTSSKVNLATELRNPAHISGLSPIQITEIFPAPKSGQKTAEWLELSNLSNQNINLKNWIIDDAEGGSKPHQIQNLILSAKQSIIFSSDQTKLNLNNKSDQVRLFTPQKKLADTIEYSEAPKNQSYSKILLDNQPSWFWTNQATPNQPNPIYHSLIGTITNSPEFNKIYHFQITDTKNRVYQINFTEDLIKAPLAKVLFNQGNSGQFIGILNTTTQPNFLSLKQYQLNPTISANNSSPLFTIIATIIAAVSLVYFLLKSKTPWKKSTSS